jgi:hypothetical protein
MEELENRRIGDAIGDIESEDDIEEEQNVEEGDPTIQLISFMKDKGSARVEVSCYDGSLKYGTLNDWIGELERYFDYENVQDPN